MDVLTANADIIQEKIRNVSQWKWDALNIREAFALDVRKTLDLKVVLVELKDAFLKKLIQRQGLFVQNVILDSKQQAQFARLKTAYNF